MQRGARPDGSHFRNQTTHGTRLLETGEHMHQPSRIDTSPSNHINLCERVETNTTQL